MTDAKLEEVDDIYRELQQHLDKMPIGFPIQWLIQEAKTKLKE